MKAIAVIPGQKDSVHLREVPEPHSSEGDILCEMLAVGVCGTDHEIIRGDYGEAPEGSDYLILGHESLGRVLEAPLSSGFRKGDLIAGIVRRPDPVPCACCARREWDMCRNGLYTERGIKGRHGFASERFRIERSFCIGLNPSLRETGVLLEPASVLAKAWDHAFAIGQRSCFETLKVLITGAGPVGLLAALMGQQRNLEVHVYDHNKSGPKPEIVKELGAIYHSTIEEVIGACQNYDITMECTGVPNLIAQLFTCIAPNGILCLTGISSGGRKFAIDVGGLNRDIVLQNHVIFGSVNANAIHYKMAARALEMADKTWLRRLISRRTPFEDFSSAYTHQPGEIKSVLLGTGEHRLAAKTKEPSIMETRP